MTNPILQELEKSQMKKKLPEFEVGDTVEVRMKIKEGEKERISVFIGTVIGRRGGALRETFTVRRLVQGEGVERIFPLHSPLLTEVRVRHKGEVRRAKLYYLRRRVGKATRIKGRTVHEVASSESQPAPESETGAAKAAEGEAPAKE